MLVSIVRPATTSKEGSLLSTHVDYEYVCAGKAKADGPEVKRGRADLAEVLWQSSNPYKDGRSLGDQWLDAKGKQRVQGPEMRRGRTVWPLCTAGCGHACMRAYRPNGYMSQSIACVHFLHADSCSLHILKVVWCIINGTRLSLM